MSYPTYTPARFSATPEQLTDVPWVDAAETRRECLMTPSPASYTYGRGRGVRTYHSTPMLPWVETIMAALNADGTAYNACFLNYYGSEREHLGWHADDHAGSDQDHPIAVVSFGQPREIWWRPNGVKGPTPTTRRKLLESGSLFVMPPGFQRTYQHRIPRGDRPMGPRVSLTYRSFR